LLILLLLVAIAAALVWIAISLARRHASQAQLAPPAPGTRAATSRG